MKATGLLGRKRKPASYMADIKKRAARMNRATRIKSRQLTLPYCKGMRG